MSVKIGHASISENGNAGWDGKAKAGDQTGREVCVRTWYNKPWTVVIRPKDPAVAEKSASACEKLCACNLVGYDQSQRNTLHTQLKACGYDVDKYIKSGVKSETDCSSFQVTLAILAGVTALEYTGNAPVTSTMENVFRNTGKYDILKDAKYLTSPDYLKRGDILLGKGHTAMVLSDGEMIKATTKSTSVSAAEDPKEFLAAVAGKYATTANLNVRNGAGTSKDKKVLVVIPKGTTVRNYGYFTTIGDTMWLYVQFTHNAVKYTGFCSGRYLKKQ